LSFIRIYLFFLSEFNQFHFLIQPIPYVLFINASLHNHVSCKTCFALNKLVNDIELKDGNKNWTFQVQ